MLRKSPLKKSEFKIKNTSIFKKTSILKSNTKLSSKSILKTTNSHLDKNVQLKKQSTVAKDKWNEVRKAVLKRDNDKCIVCGKKATQVHHIHLRSLRGDLVYTENNCVSLCDKHHFHRGTEKYKEQTELIALARRMSVEELLKFAEIKGE